MSSVCRNCGLKTLVETTARWIRTNVAGNDIDASDVTVVRCTTCGTIYQDGSKKGERR